ncbi:Guanine nucleotide-binding protein alpha-1 subunit [Capsicum chinense]|nr:Guanine nucleotide-binding protein alpha-1 subunit [Capsicum chinense]
MGLLCSRNKHYSQADDEENAQTAEIERRIEQETKADKHIQKLLLLGAGDSGKSTIFKQARDHKKYLLRFHFSLNIKLLFQTGFDEEELKNYIPVIHANVYQTIKILHDGSKELAQNELEASKYLLSAENKEIGEKLSEIGGRLDYPHLTNDLVQDIEALWKDPAIQETLLRGNELQVPDCAHYFMENLLRFSDLHYLPTKQNKEKETLVPISADSSRDLGTHRGMDCQEREDNQNGEDAEVSDAYGGREIEKPLDP